MRSESARGIGLAAQVICACLALLVWLPAAAASNPRWQLRHSEFSQLLIEGPNTIRDPLGPLGRAPAIGAPRGVSRGIGAAFDEPLIGRLSTEAGPGINLNWFDLGEGCDREPFAILTKLHQPGVRARVLELLIELRARGSESIAVGIFHFRAPGPTVDGVWDNGTLMDSTGGALHPRMRQNLVDLLADIRAAGFSQLLLRFHPQGDNDPAQWSSYSESHFEENWNLIAGLMPVVQESGLNWRVDLWTEGMPRARFLSVFGELIVLANEPDNEAWSRYSNRLWQNYVSRFDPARSVGFSSIADGDPDRLRARIEHTSYVYRLDGGERVYPGAFAFDIYGREDADEGVLFRRIVDRLDRIGLGEVPVMIAESYYNDRFAMGVLSAAMRETGKRPLYMLHWPVDRQRMACSPHVNVAAPVEVDQMLRFGF